MTTNLYSPDQAAMMSRREAIRRAALFLGVAITPSLLTGVLQAQTPAAAGAGAGAKPLFLTPKQLDTAGAAAERILPRTDTPGALDVGVPAFIDLMYGKYMTEGEQRAFSTGLDELDLASVAAHRTGFSRLTADQQDAVLRGLAENLEIKERAFFRQLKELTVLGYFTSETVGKTVTHYDPVPGHFNACVPISEVGNRTWTK